MKVVKLLKHYKVGVLSIFAAQDIWVVCTIVSLCPLRYGTWIMEKILAKGSSQMLLKNDGTFNKLIKVLVLDKRILAHYAPQ